MNLRNLRYRHLVLLTIFLALLSAVSCLKDPGSYEAEIETICFVRRPDAQSIRVVSDTLRPSSTRSYVMLTHDARLDSIIPVFTLSPGATSDVKSGMLQKVDSTFSITVTSENGRVSRVYRFDLTKQDDPLPPLMPGGLELNGEAYLSNFALENIDAQITMKGTRIEAIVNEAVDLSSLKPTFELSQGATCDFPLGETYDFNDPLFIRVESENKASVTTYRIFVRHDAPPLESDAEIWDFQFEESSKHPDVNGSMITFFLEKDLDLKKLTPRFELSNGATSSLRSGETADFSSPVKITVYSQDRSAKTVYTVTVYSAKGDRAELLQFALKELINPDNKTGAPDLINATEIRYWVPDDIDLAKLTPQFILSDGATASIANDTQIDLQNPIDFVITSEDGFTTRTYRLIVEKANGSGHNSLFDLDIQSVSFPDILGEVRVNIYRNRIVAIVPAGTDLSKLSVSFALPMSTTIFLYDGKVELKSSDNILDCTKPVKLYIKKLASWKDYLLEVYVSEQEAQPKIQEFSFQDIAEKVVVGENKIYCFVPASVDRTRMIPRFSLAPGCTASLQAGKEYDFSNPRQITVTSASGAQQKNYTIEVAVGMSSEAELIGLRFDEVQDLPAIKGSRIDLFVGEKVNVKSLTPRFSLSRGATATIESGTPRDFSNPVRITVVSEDKSVRKVYTVYVEQHLNTEAEILTFSFKEYDAQCSIEGTNILFAMPPSGISLSKLTPVFTLSHGATSTPVSGAPADFSSTVTIAVTSQDGNMTKSYKVRPSVKSIKYDFESWQGFESGKYFYEHPRGAWSSGNPGLKMALKFGKPKRYPMRKTSDAHTGQYAAVLSTEELQLNGIRIAAGSLFIGEFDAKLAMHAPLTCPKFGVAYPNPLPDRFKGWYKYSAGASNQDKNGNAVAQKDKPDIYAILYSGETITAATVQDNPNIIAIARVPDLEETATYTHFDIPFDYLLPVPSGVVLKFSIILTSSRKGGVYEGAVGSELTVDDLEITVR